MHVATCTDAHVYILKMAVILQLSPEQAALLLPVLNQVQDSYESEMRTKDRPGTDSQVEPGCDVNVYVSKWQQ